MMQGLATNASAINNAVHSDSTVSLVAIRLNLNRTQVYYLIGILITFNAETVV